MAMSMWSWRAGHMLSGFQQFLLLTNTQPSVLIYIAALGP